MSAGPPAPEESGADPSMEDILASIRRILNEDDAPAAAAEPPAPEPAATPAPPAAATTPPPSAVTAAATAAASAGEEDDVLVLDEAMLVTPPADVAEPEPAPEPASAYQAPPIVPVAYTPPPGAEPLHDGGLLAPESAAAAASSVSALLRTLSTERTTQVHRGGPTIEDLVREELRPLVKAWLDEFLPPLVERLVRQEIERVAGRAGL